MFYESCDFDKLLRNLLLKLVGSKIGGRQAK